MPESPSSPQPDPATAERLAVLARDLMVPVIHEGRVPRDPAGAYVRGTDAAERRAAKAAELLRAVHDGTRTAKQVVALTCALVALAGIERPESNAGPRALLGVVDDSINVLRGRRQCPPELDAVVDALRSGGALGDAQIAVLRDVAESGGRPRRKAHERAPSGGMTQRGPDAAATAPGESGDSGDVHTPTHARETVAVHTHAHTRTRVVGAGGDTPVSPDSPGTSEGEEAPDPTRVERNRLRFLGWLAEAAGRLSLWAGEFDVQGIQRPKPADVPMCEGWWVIRPEALPVYIARVLHSEPQYRPKSNALLLTTIYLLAMRVSGGEDGAADATLQLRRIGRAEFVPAEIRRVADQVRIGELAPHATWIGPLEWALLQLAGVRWPGYVVDLAQLREGCQDEIDREVGLRLVKGLGGYLPLIIGAGDRDEQRVLRHCHAFSGDVVTQLREVLLESARQAARDTAHPAPQRRDAGIAVIGLLIRAYGGSWSDKQKESLRDVAEAGLDAVSVLATRLLRHPPDACDRSAKDEFWKCCEQPAPPAAEQPQITAQPTAAPAQHAPNFEWIEVEGKRYEFSKAQQRAVVQVLWEAAGRPLHETSVGDAINSTTDYFRLKTVFRVKGGAKHPAMGKVLIKTAPRTYRLAR